MTSSAAVHRRIVRLAEPYDGVLSRTLLREAGIGRGGVARQVNDARWRTVGRRTVVTHTHPLSQRALAWQAFWEVDRPDVAVDGVTALEQAGLTGFEAHAIDVSVPWEARVARVAGVRIHRVCRVDNEIVPVGLPRVRPATAAIRAALWAGSDRQAALLLVLPVQQRLVLPAHLDAALRNDHVRGRRPLIRQLVADIVDGAHSLGELDFARLCRQAGLPPPDRQVVVELSSNRVYLDVRWHEIGLVVEIDGSHHHTDPHMVSADNLRQNAVTIGDDVVLRYDLLLLRVRPDDVMAQVREAHAALRHRRH